MKPSRSVTLFDCIDEVTEHVLELPAFRSNQYSRHGNGILFQYFTSFIIPGSSHGLGIGKRVTIAGAVSVPIL
jgi:hypothetical protein